jgi:thioredoxin:protein disulfide reductase
VLVGAFSGSLNALPRAGEWMVRIKEFYGFLLLGTAFYFAQPLIGAPWAELLTAILLASFAGFLGLFTAPTADPPLNERVRKSIAVVALAVACAFAISATSRWGGLCFAPGAGQGNTGRAGNADIEGFYWHPGLEPAITEARRTGRPIFVDVRADWCAICKKIEEQVFPHPAVAPLLARMVRVKFDATESTAAVKDFFTRFAIPGLPTLLLLDPTGQELTSLRVVGDITPADLARTLRLAEQTISPPQD